MVTAWCLEASSAPVSANGSANTEWLNRTNEKYVLSLIDAIPEDFQVAIRMIRRAEPEARVKAVRVACDQLKPPQSLQVRMVHDEFHHPFTQSLPAVGLEHVDVTQ